MKIEQSEQSRCNRADSGRVMRGGDGCAASVHVGVGVTMDHQSEKQELPSCYKTFQADMINRWLAERCVWGVAAFESRTPASALFGDFTP